MIFIYLNLINILAFFTLWVLFVNCMNWKHNKEKIPNWLKYPLYPIVVFTYLLDVAYNWIFGTIIFLELPREPTLSERMRRILITRDDWRFDLAKWICLHLVEPWDQNHCGLAND